ncbi:hypothetical protein KC19_6G200500 [Ceratodon purpureus]|uniref:Uncharacterized protein n=1 Tax=Ceratodon purpureus TaxID=3225 RepID=A0A8T0HJJ5_CERPU|nr:hypothetical protein KC19_6G200500 [Ceratodon purpureus]
MRAKTLLCRLRKLHAVRLHDVVPQTGTNSGLVARSMSSVVAQRGVSRVADSGVGSVLFGDVRANAGCSLHAKENVSMSLGSVRFMGVGSFKEGNRAGQHGAKIPQGKPDGSPEKAEADAREQFLEKAKAESASNQAQEPFRDEVESGQSFGEATTELEFGVKDGKDTNEAISNASEQLFKQSTINAKSGEGPIKEEDKRKYPEHQKAEVSSEASSEKQTHSSPDDSNKADLQGQENESVLGIGGHPEGKSHTDEASASGETARENIDKTRSEMRAGKARSPQAGVIVGNVSSTGANAIDNDEKIPEHAFEEETGEETLDKAQKMYEKAISGFGTGGDKNLKDDPNETSDAKFHKN